MPTIILLDASLSMSRPVVMPDTTEEYQRRHLAVHGINCLLDYITEHCKLEFISLVEFSSTTCIKTNFTRDYEQIKAALTKTEDSLGDKTCLEAAFASLTTMVLEEWGVHNPCQLILLTDGSTGVGEGSLGHSLKTLPHRGPRNQFPLPYTFQCNLIIPCIAPPNDKDLQAALPLYQKLITLNNGEGEIFVPEGPLHLRTMQSMFTKISEKYYKQFLGTLKCGNLKCSIQLYPPPAPYESNHDFERIEKTISRVIEICGFMDIADVASPPYISRHLVQPQPVGSDNGSPSADSSKEEEEEEKEGCQATFTVLLHGSLKVEGMVALTQLADDWYGIIYSWADGKKKSKLMLSVFTPGVNVVPWLGNLTHLGPTEDFSTHPYGDEDDAKTPFPLRPSDRRSYTQNCVVWLKQTGIQADIQKILRNARKLPEKQQHFYKELNRLRRAALAYGFYDLMDALAQLLERECTMLPGNAHPDAALQLTHAANSLKNDKTKDVVINVIPLRTNFTAD